MLSFSNSFIIEAIAMGYLNIRYIYFRSYLFMFKLLQSKINSLKMMFMHVVYDVFDLSKADFDYFDLLKVYPPVRKNEKKWKLDRESK